MSNHRYGAEDEGRQAAWRGDRSRGEQDREDHRGSGPSYFGREREFGSESRSFSSGRGGDPYGDHGQGSERFLDERGSRHGSGPDYGATHDMTGATRPGYGAPRGEGLGRREAADFGPGPRGDRDRAGPGGYAGGRGSGLGPDNPMLANLADGRDATAGQHRGRGPKNYVRSDERIREDVSDRLADEPHLDASDVEVQVQNGEVTLTGTVDHRHSKRLAEDRAEEVSGVKHVQNNLRVKEALLSSVSGNNNGSATPSRAHN